MSVKLLRIAVNSQKAGYWASAVLLVLGMLSGGITHLIQAKDGMNHLSYPLYFISILGTWKFPA